MKYNQFVELFQDDDPYEVTDMCLKYIKEANSENKTIQHLVRIAKKEFESEYLLPDIISLTLENVCGKGYLILSGYTTSGHFPLLNNVRG
jgi:hypothetical protein